jgi:L-rhamnose-proton symport protein (RhaT)
MNPIVGVIYHWLGGLASGSFYVPFRGVKRWSWETSWLAAGVFSWIIAPWVFATLNTTDPVTVLKETPGQVWFYSYLFGALWGIGGLTFGLAMRYLGMSLGMAVALGYCTVFGTLIPPIFKGEFKEKLIDSSSGPWILAGLAVCVIGIIVTAMAGKAKEGEMTEEQKRNTVKEFSFKKGILVATFSGIMSACFAFGLTAGDWIRATTYNVDMVNSAKSAGKTLGRTSEPSGAEDKAFADSLAASNIFKPGVNGSMKIVLDALEEPFTAQAKIAALKAKATLTGLENEDLEKIEAKMPEVTKKAQEALAAVKTSANPIATRIATYGDQLATVAANAPVFGIVDNLSYLSEKETALSISASGADLKTIHEQHNLWTGLPVLIVVLLGGFTTNFIWCLILNMKNKTGYQYFSSRPGAQSPVANPAIAAGEGASFDGRKDPSSVPLIGNYLFAALAGTLWYFQFFFYSMGETQMGDYKFSSWTLHMASIIIFSSIWGLALREWKGASAKSKGLLFAGLGILVLSTVIIGYGNYVSGASGH